MTPSQIDPTKTATLRRKWMKAVRQQYFSIGVKVSVFLKQDTPQDIDQVEYFQNWLRGVVSNDLKGYWWESLLQETYEKGVLRAFKDGRKKESVPSNDFRFGQEREFLLMVRNDPQHVLTMSLLMAHLKNSFGIVADELVAKMVRVWLDDARINAVGTGLKRSLADALATSMERAILTAETELVRIHAEGQLDGLSSLGINELKLFVEWIAVNDGRTCQRCGSMDGSIFPTEEARGLIPVHPRCRCAWLPANY